MVVLRNKILKVAVAITTLICVLSCSLLPVFAYTDEEYLNCLDDEYCAFTDDDPNISYSEYLFNLDTANIDISTFNIGNEVFYSLGPEFASAGLVLSKLPFGVGSVGSVGTSGCVGIVGSTGFSSSVGSTVGTSSGHSVG